MNAIIYILLIITTDITSYFFQKYEVIYATPLVLLIWLKQITTLHHINHLVEKLEYTDFLYKISIGIEAVCIIFFGVCVCLFIIHRYELSSLLLITFGVKISGSQLLLWSVARDYGKLCKEIRQHGRSRLTGP